MGDWVKKAGKEENTGKREERRCKRKENGHSQTYEGCRIGENEGDV